MVVVPLNPPEQYADDRNLSARQRFWQHQSPYFDIVGWVLELARPSPGMRVLDAGCGNGVYLRALAGGPGRAAGCDPSMGMRDASLRLPNCRNDRNQDESAGESVKLPSCEDWIAQVGRADR
jgi:SAM-dependent methyltransferase